MFIPVWIRSKVYKRLYSTIIKPFLVVYNCHCLQFTEDGDVQTYPYSITSLADKRDFMQKGDVVKFRVAVNSLSNELRAVNVTAVRQFIRAKVESVKDKVRT